MNKTLVAAIIEYAKKLSDENLVGENGTVSVKEGESAMYITRHGADLANLTEADIINVSFFGSANVSEKEKAEIAVHTGIYKAQPETGAIMHTQPANACVCANEGVTIPPVLDDMSQIVGANIKTAQDLTCEYVLKAIKGRNACLVRNKGMLSSGRTLDEAYTACLVLEKAAKTFIEGTIIGGCVSLGLLDANLQRFIYKKKYSKANQAAKMNEEHN